MTRTEILKQMIDEMPTNTATEIARVEQMIYYYNRRDIDNGAAGRIFELYCSRDYSHKITVARQGEVDCYFKIVNNDSKVAYIPMECKTNGGRISALYELNAPKYVCYFLDIKNKLVPNGRTVFPRLIKTSEFLDTLENCNAIKNTNGKYNEIAIQATSKKWFIALQSIGVEFHRNTTYNI